YYLGRPLGQIIGLEAAYNINEEWRVGGNGQIALDNDDGPVELEGYEVFNVYVSHKPEQFENVELRLDVKNIFDETYQLRSSDGIGNPRVLALNEPGRTFQFTTRIKF
ncbi:MAG: TonB-dependent receptor, partial [Pseudomonadota bacterium]